MGLEGAAYALRAAGLAATYTGGGRASVGATELALELRLRDERGAMLEGFRWPRPRTKPASHGVGLVVSRDLIWCPQQPSLPGSPAAALAGASTA